MGNEERGRPGICGNDKAVSISYKMCPDTRKALKEFCRENGFLASQVINWAVMSYIARNQK